MSQISQFFDKQADRFGPSGILPHHEARAVRLRRVVGDPPLRILELGCGSGGAAAACARAGYAVTAVELSPKRAGFARDLAASEGEGRLDVREGDFYTADLGGPFDAVTYWNGFGVGDDRDGRRLLHRVAEEWLVPGGTMLVDVFNPAWWARLPNEPKRHDEYDAWQQTVYDAERARFVDTWWSAEDASDALQQSVRCYAPVDLALLLQGTGLRFDRIELGDPAQPLPFEDAYSYLAILRRG